MASVYREIYSVAPVYRDIQSTGTDSIQSTRTHSMVPVYRDGQHGVTAQPVSTGTYSIISLNKRHFVTFEGQSAQPQALQGHIEHSEQTCDKNTKHT